MSDALDIATPLGTGAKSIHSMHPCGPVPMQQVRWLRQIQLIIKIETIAGKSRMADGAGGRFLSGEGAVVREYAPAEDQFVSALEEEGLLWMPACAGMTDDAGEAVS